MGSQAWARHRVGYDLEAKKGSVPVLIGGIRRHDRLTKVGVPSISQLSGAAAT